MISFKDFESAIKSLESEIYKGITPPEPRLNLKIKLKCGENIEGKHLNKSGDFIIFEITSSSPSRIIFIPLNSISYISY